MNSKNYTSNFVTEDNQTIVKKIKIENNKGHHWQIEKTFFWIKFFVTMSYSIFTTSVIFFIRSLHSIKHTGRRYFLWSLHFPTSRGSFINKVLFFKVLYAERMNDLILTNYVLFNDRTIYIQQIICMFITLIEWTIDW